MENATVDILQRRRNLICNVIDNNYKTLMTLADATSLLTVVGTNTTHDRFFFSDPQMSHKLMRELDRKFVKKQADILSTRFVVPTQIVMDLSVENDDIFPEFSLKEKMNFQYPSHKIRLEFKFTPKKKGTNARFELIGANNCKYFVAPVPRDKNNGFATDIAEIRGIQGMNTLFAIFWASSVSSVQIYSCKEASICEEDTIVAKHAAENAIFGIRDFLRTNMRPCTYVPPSYANSIREIIQEVIVEDSIYNNSCHFVYKQKEVDSLLAKKELVNEWDAYYRRIQKTQERHFQMRARHPSFSRTIWTKYLTGYGIIDFMMFSELMYVTSKFRPISRWGNVLALASLLGDLNIGKLKQEERDSYSMVRSALMYYEFLDAVRSKGMMELLAASV